MLNKDYFPALADMADSNCEIDSDISGKKTLDLFLAEKLGISKPSFLEQLSLWEKQGKVKIEKSFIGHITKIKIIAASTETKPKNIILMVLDWSNIWMNIPDSEKFSLAAGLDRLQRQIVNDIGEIAIVFVGIPPHATTTEQEIFLKQGFYMLSCPRVETKESRESNSSETIDRDTTDDILINLINDTTSLMPGITHICLGSGDKDFCQALRRAIRRQLKVMIVAGDLKSLSRDLIALADMNPVTGKKMVYILSQSKD